MSIEMDLAKSVLSIDRPSLKGEAQRFLEKSARPSSCERPLKVFLVGIYESSFQSMNKEALVIFKGLSQD
jgi:hypothetical protein